MNGKPLKLEVVVNGSPKPIVKWFKDDQEIVGEGYVSDAKDKTHSLSVGETNPTNSGVYKCVAENAAGKIECIANVVIQTKPQITKVDDVKIISGEEFSVPITITGSPEPKMKWQKDKKEIPSSLGIVIEKREDGHLMFLKESNTNLSGSFSVTATNPAGSDTITFKVVVLGKFV